MRIAQLITQSRGGPVDHAVDLARELARLGHESHLLGPDGDHLARLAGSGVVVHRVAVDHKRDLAGARRLARRVAEIDPDVLHCQDRRAGLVGRLACWRGGTATVYTLHGVPDPLAHLVAGNLAAAPPSRQVAIANTWGERALARARRSVVVTPCEAVADYVRRHVGVPAGRVVAVHNGISADWAADRAPDRAPGSASPSGDDDGTTTVAWLGVMQPVKRLPALVAAVADTPRLRLLLIGDGPERSRVEGAVAAAGVGDRVEFAGFRSDPAPWLARADLLALPSAAEACPMALLQAMSAGLPVVASRAGGIPEVVRDGVDGLLVPTGDDAALRRALARLRDEPALRRRLGGQGRQRVAERFTVTHCARELIAVYEGVAA